MDRSPERRSSGVVDLLSGEKARVMLTNLIVVESARLILVDRSNEKRKMKTESGTTTRRCLILYIIPEVLWIPYMMKLTKNIPTRTMRTGSKPLWRTTRIEKLKPMKSLVTALSSVANPRSNSPTTRMLCMITPPIIFKVEQK